MAQRQDWRQLGRFPEQVEFRTSGRGSLRPLFAGIVMVLVSIALLVYATPSTLRATFGWIGLVVFVPLTVFVLLRAVRPRVVLRLAGGGLDDRSSLASVGFVPWDQVVRAVSAQMAGNPMVAVLVTDPEAVLAQMPALRRSGARANLGLADPHTPVWIVTTQLDIDHQDLADLINDYRASWGAQRGGGYDTGGSLPE